MSGAYRKEEFKKQYDGVIIKKNFTNMYKIEGE